MPTGPTTDGIEHLRRAVLQRDGAGLGDGELLGRFVESRDDAALAALVKRHGPMVWGVCRRLLSHHDAEDAFQAAVLVLVRKAASVVPREMLGNWLYGVAHRTALQAKRAAARRGAREVQIAVMPDIEAAPRDGDPDVQLLLDRELSRLPDGYRVVVVLCDLEGRTRKEAARQLGVPEGTVAGRLARARALLAKRLARRGVSTSSGASAAAFAREASAGLPHSAAFDPVCAANLVSAGRATPGPISPAVNALTQGTLNAMLMSKLKAAVAVALGVAAIGSVVLTYRATAAPGDKPPAAEVQVTPNPDADEKAFTAWGDESGGLQAGLGFRPGQKRTYRHGETVRLVVRIRNVGQEEVKFQYLNQFLIEKPPAVTDGEGKPIRLGGVTAYGFHVPVDAALAPGKEIELHELKLALRPASESVKDPYSAVYGTGKFQIQYERVIGNSSSGWLVKPDPNPSKLGTGKLELEIESDPPAAKK